MRGNPFGERQRAIPHTHLVRELRSLVRLLIAADPVHHGFNPLRHIGDMRAVISSNEN